MKNLITPITLLLILCVVGCNKEEINPTVNQYTTIQPSQLSTSLTTTQIEQIALQHNQYLEDCFANFNYQNPDLQQEVYNKFLTLSVTGLTRNDKQNILDNSPFPNRVNLDSMTNDSNIVLYYNIIDNLLENATSFNVLSQQINNIKLQINNDRSVVDKNSALIYCEVALKSSYFWMPQSIGGSGVGEGITGNYSGARKKWWRITKHDAGGVVIGFLKGGLLGAIFWGAFSSAVAGILPY